MEFSSRDLAVLQEVVRLFIRTGEPVASREVAKRSTLGLSPASIRNVMAHLEEAGFLSRAHPSAGCIPTDSSLRVYVDSAVPKRSLPAETRRRLFERMVSVKRELVEDIEWVAQLVAEATSGAGVAIRPMGEESVFEAVSLVDLGGSRVLGVVVTVDGAVEKRVLSLCGDWDAEDLEVVTSYMNRSFRGSSPDQIRATLEPGSDGETDAANEVVDQLTREVVEQLFASGEDDAEVRVAGAENLLNTADFEHVDRLRSLLRVLQDRARLVREWRRVFSDGPTQVIIGRESEVTASARLGMVATLFFRDGRRVGAVGVVGPRRMDYGRIVPVVEFIGDNLTQMLESGGVQHV